MGRPKGSRNSKGVKRIVATNGYVTLFMPDHHLAMANGYVYEHRLVMEQKLGRRLQAEEEPHHKDENKENNHPDNLELNVVLISRSVGATRRCA